jgi:hypothetical protein
MKDLTKTMEIMQEAEEEEGGGSDETKGEIHSTGGKSAAMDGETSTNGKPYVATETGGPKVGTAAAAGTAGPTVPDATGAPQAEASAPRPKGIPTQQLLMDRSETQRLLTDQSEEERKAAEGTTEQEEELKRKLKKKGLSKDQREELHKYEEERRKVRQERVDTLSRKLIDRISVWTETDKTQATTHAFNEKTKYEVENLKMESFGIDILHGRDCYVSSMRRQTNPYSQLLVMSTFRKVLASSSPRSSWELAASSAD